MNELLSTLPCSYLQLAIEGHKDNVEELRELYPSLAGKYELYQDIILNYRRNLVNSDMSNNKDLLINYYEHAPTLLNKELVRRRNAHSLYQCPYCGNPQRPDTLDHFIPKSSWPEFSIFSNNLVPQCRACAPIKGEHYFCNETETAKFIHPFYFDLLQKFRFKIVVNFNTVSNTPDFIISLTRREIVSDEEKSRVLLHVKNLKIKSRIHVFCHEEYRRWSNRLSKSRFDIRVALQQRLSETPAENVGLDWKSALYQGLIDNMLVINHLHSLRPNENINLDLENIEELEIE